MHGVLYLKYPFEHSVWENWLSNGQDCDSVLSVGTRVLPAISALLLCMGANNPSRLLHCYLLSLVTLGSRSFLDPMILFYLVGR